MPRARVRTGNKYPGDAKCYTNDCLRRTLDYANEHPDGKTDFSSNSKVGAPTPPPLPHPPSPSHRGQTV